MIFSKIDVYVPEKIAEDDLITTRTKNHNTLEDWKQTWMNKMGEDVLFVSAIAEENIEELRRKIYQAVRKIHVNRYPYNDFLYPDLEKLMKKLKNIILMRKRNKKKEKIGLKYFYAIIRLMR